MMRTPADYAEQLRQLLPPGRAWQRGGGTVLDTLLTGLADALSRVDVRATGLLDEADPLTALELLPDWEQVAGLPDQCLPTSGTVRERQLRVARKISGIGGQNAQFFIDQAALLGLSIGIEEFRPFRVGARCTSRVQSTAWAHVWLVRVLPASEGELSIRSSWLHAGSRSGERIRSFSIDELECVIRRAAPAHSIVLFAYPVDPEPVLWFDFLSEYGDY